MADPSESTTHGLYLSGPFLIEAKEYRTYTTFIGCSGGAQEERLRYKVVARGFSQADFMLEAGHIYFLRGSFFPTTEEAKDNIIFFEASDRVLLNSANAFVGDLVDAIGVTGVGIVCNITSIVEPARGGLLKNPKDENKPTTIVTVLHSDFHPTTKVAAQFTVEYRIPPTPNLAGTPKILKVGREFQFHGFIKDYDPQNLRYVVIASKVSPTNGNKEYEVCGNGVKVKKEDVKPFDLINKPVKFNKKNFKSAAKSPIKSTALESSSTLAFPPSDFGPESYRSASSSLAGPSGSSVSPEKDTATEITIAAPKKRARTQPKRITKKDKTLDLTLSKQN
ncbi:uncharacterized protein MELLADRAFT_89738 [Melampsora larici-populina 98AG31]|uniref:Uncharacterized protein n=1 Tax=Melampsora larici-populina (strain 98AG31 / pathotype 3-4-7) TaxID=747676 RepID=F4RUF7_MELLP|nr:uncharacterized protein MELLADRAFT_89738 [Melampsora larici-populina 98AG31]EGG04006.1 hypothetical protein MELLADRAFT_89738 [Melampsora larici-populina 98AG31]